jgi:head-tail adaptor
MALDYCFVVELEDDFLIERPSYTPDGTGGFTTVYNTVSTQKGRLDEERFNEAIRAGQDTVYITHRLFLYPNTDIQRNDQVTGKGRVLRVIMLATEYEDFPLEVLCQEIDP